MSSVPVGLLSTAMARAASIAQPTALLVDYAGEASFNPLTWLEAKRTWQAVRHCLPLPADSGKLD